MNIENVYERKVEVAEKEIGDKLFYLLWSMTIVQLALIVWEWINLIHPLNSLLGLSDKIEIKAIELSTTGYLVIQLAYMGKKEITRWVKKADTVLNPNEYIRRIRRGDTAILLWGILYILGIVCVALHIIVHMPAELSRTFIQVTTLYTCAFVSKAAFKGRMKQDKQINHTGVPEGEQGITARAALESATNKEIALVEFIRDRKVVDIRDCIDHLALPKSTVNLMLKNMVDSGLLLREGSSRSVTYFVSKEAAQSLNNSDHAEK